ncbi:hypothetical protein HNY73_018489 [Argiope bruennichi]|uniref:Uncharacterized protein n=1 Tax=Argiope bruennichi TaxID=94029 RepID=A0A8T0EI09_ARGBR|nr:hypothetical protein HNY73_018489 [Argiope bruennichi]
MRFYPSPHPVIASLTGPDWLRSPAVGCDAGVRSPGVHAAFNPCPLHLSTIRMTRVSLRPRFARSPPLVQASLSSVRPLDPDHLAPSRLWSFPFHLCQRPWGAGRPHHSWRPVRNARPPQGRCCRDTETTKNYPRLLISPTRHQFCSSDSCTMVPYRPGTGPRLARAWMLTSLYPPLGLRKTHVQSNQDRALIIHPFLRFATNALPPHAHSSL